MENKINVAELLKDCQKGMELDCVLYEDVTFECILDESYPIQIQTPEGKMRLSKYGCMSLGTHAKCVIFPKGKTTWEGFRRPFKDGDIVFYDDTIAIFKEWDDEDLFRTYVTKYLCCDSLIDTNVSLFGKNVRKKVRFATEEEKQKLLQAIKDKGYEWNEETKTLKELIDRNKFVIGDTITNRKRTCKIHSKDVDSYKLEDGTYVFFNEVHNWELASDKFDINTLKIFESKVLVRDNKDENWKPAIFGGFKKERGVPYVVVGGLWFKYLIPYEGNENLYLSKNDCDDFYKTWE